MTVLIAEAVSLPFHIQSIEQWNLHSWLRTDRGSKTHLGRIFCAWLRIMCMVMCGKWVLHQFEITRENDYMWFACHHFLVVNGHLICSSHFLQLEYWYWHVPFRNAWISKKKKKDFHDLLSLYFLEKVMPHFLYLKIILKSMTKLQQKYVILGGMKIWNFKRTGRNEFSLRLILFSLM